MLPMVMLALCMQTGGSPQTPKLKADKPVVSHIQTNKSSTKSKRNVKPLSSRHKGREFSWRSAQATCFTVAENGRSTANNERCFSDGPEYLCAMPSNLNPGRVYCQHKKGTCRPIYVPTVDGEIIAVHVVDHCPHSSVIDLNIAAANKIFKGKDSSKQDWFSRAKLRWDRD